MAIGFGQSDLHGFDLQVDDFGRIGRIPGDIEFPQQAQRNEGRQPLAVGRNLVQIHTAVIN